MIRIRIAATTGSYSFFKKVSDPIFDQNQKGIKINKWGWGVHIFLFKIFSLAQLYFLSDYTGAFSVICRSRGETFIFAQRDVHMVALFFFYIPIKPIPGVRKLRK